MRDAKWKQIENMWDRSMNNTAPPSEYGASLHDMAWWKCPEGHSFRGYVRDIYNSGACACPVCKRGTFEKPNKSAEWLDDL